MKLAGSLAADLRVLVHSDENGYIQYIYLFDVTHPRTGRPAGRKPCSQQAKGSLATVASFMCPALCHGVARAPETENHH